MKPRFSRWEWLILAVVLAVLLAALTSCGHRGLLPVGEPAPWFHAGPVAVLARIAIVATAVAGSGLIACALLAWFYPDKGAVLKLAIACGTIIIGSQIAYQLGQHIVLATVLSLVALIAGGALWAWLHLGKVERFLGVDLNKDGRKG